MEHNLRKWSDLSIPLYKYFCDLNYYIILVTNFKNIHILISKTSYDWLCNHLWCTNLVVHIVHHNMLDQPFALYAQELLNMLAGVSIQIHFYQFPQILILDNMLSFVMFPFILIIENLYTTKYSTNQLKLKYKHS